MSLLVYGCFPRSETRSQLFLEHICHSFPRELYMIIPLLLGTVVSSSYVAAIKVAVPEHIKGRERNDPSVIRFRVRRILWLCLFLMLTIPPISAHLEEGSNTLAELKHLGLIPGLTSTYSLRTDLCNVAFSLSKICTLYMGPIFLYLYTEAHNWRADIKESFGTIRGLRDHVFAPITEELVYRAALVAVLKSVLLEKSIVLYSPLFFGLAHIHHGFSLYYEGKFPIAAAVASSGFQFIYTTLFGILANTLYVKSGYNLWCPIVVHAVCNLLGFPSFEIKETHPRLFYGYIALLVLGMITFWRVL